MNSTVCYCCICDKNYSCSSALYRHQRRAHGFLRKESYGCTECGEVAVSKENWLTHLQVAHELQIHSEQLQFLSESDFHKWKEEVEHETRSRYVRQGGPSHSIGKTTKYYYCHRSGNYVSKSKGMRSLKVQGSGKIGGKCPANMTVEVLTDGTCQVTFVSTHFGHDQDLSHLHLTKMERDALAASLGRKIPHEAVIDEVRESVSDSVLERKHLLTKQDLYNIERSYNLCSRVVRHPNDAISVEAWVTEVNSSDSPCVIFYKPQGKGSDTHPQLQNSDFVLIIMSNAQCQLLKKYGSDCICIDGTHGLNNYDFQLFTVLVLDDMRQGFPAAFLISNRSGTEVMRIFFSYVRETAGHISPKVFMSDLAKPAYNAWILEMGYPSMKLFCTWHVTKAWRTQIRKKIQGSKKQDEVYNNLKALLYETNAEKFETVLPAFLETLENDDDTKVFASYFKANYLENVRSWAYCYRLYSGINTNMHLESMHRTIKHIYLHGKRVKRLDKAIFALMCFLRDKLIDRLIVAEKGKVTSKIRGIRHSHDRSLCINQNLIVKEEDVWKVPSQSKENEVYFVTLNDELCNCKIKCMKCDTCIHKYYCTCIDFTIKWNMCKHVHSVCLFEAKNRPHETNRTVVLNKHDQNIVNEREEILAEVSKKGTSKNCSPMLEWKRTVISEFSSLIDGISSTEERKAVDRQLSCLKATLTAVHIENNEFCVTKRDDTCAARKIVPQRKVLSVKRSISQQSVTAHKLTISKKVAVCVLEQHESHTGKVSDAPEENAACSTDSSVGREDISTTDQEMLQPPGSSDVSDTDQEM